MVAFDMCPAGGSQLDENESALVLRIFFKKSVYRQHSLLDALCIVNSFHPDAYYLVVQIVLLLNLLDSVSVRRFSLSIKVAVNTYWKSPDTGLFTRTDNSEPFGINAG